MTITEYVKGNDTIENKTTFIFRTMKRLEYESLDIYIEVCDLKDISLDIIQNLSTKMNKLLAEYNDASEALLYLRRRLSHDYDVAAVGLLFKSSIAIPLIAASYTANQLFGIIAFILLTKNMFNSYMSKRKKLDDRYEMFDDSLLFHAKTSIDNSKRRIKGLVDKKIAKNEDNDLFADYYLSLVLNNIIDVEDYDSFEELDSLPYPVKNRMISLLQQRLDAKDTDLFDLINIAKRNGQTKLQLS